MRRGEAGRYHDEFGGEGCQLALEIVSRQAYSDHVE
jgi:hypothetical protein